ncbi:hypothetical protein FOA52_013095 [Chlamydomonas sp. UWO 241]|nr:hypothetical protein FOA52_013095 [Chlamydomonas sp. UWO 241]
MYTRLAARRAVAAEAEAASRASTASAHEVLLSLDLFEGHLWRWVDGPSKRALRGVCTAMRCLVDGVVQIVCSPSYGCSGEGLMHALVQWPRVRDLTLLNVSGSYTLQPLATCALAGLKTLTIRESPADVPSWPDSENSEFWEEDWEREDWVMPELGSVAATLEVIDISHCSDLVSIDAVRSCVKLRCLRIPGVSAFDLSPLAACSQTLEELWMAAMYVDSLVSLKACTGLLKPDVCDCSASLRNQVADLQTACTQLADPSTVEVEGLVFELRPNMPPGVQEDASPTVPNGATRLRNRLLEARGWRVTVMSMDQG